MGEDGKGCNGEVCTDEKEWKIVVERIVGRGTNDAEVRKVEQNERNGVVVKQRKYARNFSENEVGIERRGEKDFASEDLKREETRTVRAEH